MWKRSPITLLLFFGEITFYVPVLAFSLIHKPLNNNPPLISKSQNVHSTPIRNFRNSLQASRQIHDENFEIPQQLQQQQPYHNLSYISRRRFIPLATTVTSGLLLTNPESAEASAEVDRKSGELFSPKSQMLGGGGSDAARGISLRTRTEQSGKTAVNEKKFFANRDAQNIQNIYNTRFITYLSRFLLTFDPAARAWWEESTAKTTKAGEESTFANFAESVEVGLVDYFSGPYGSYGSVQAAKAGISAKAQIPSSRSDINEPNSFFSLPNISDILQINNKTTTTNASTKKKTRSTVIKKRKQGVLNLLALLQARYVSKEEKLQLAILFSFISDPALQPTNQISALLGESDNASIQSIDILKGAKSNMKTTRTVQFNRDPDRDKRGGYSSTDIPKITISPPPALGRKYKCASAQPIMRPTSRILRIKVIDGGSGYTYPPTVTVASGNIKSPSSSFQACQATAILNREGQVESIVVLNPGYGYEGTGNKKVSISLPLSKKKKGVRPATAIAEMEYEICDIDVTDGGNGYVSTSLPKTYVFVEPPKEDPDWFLLDSDMPLSQQYTQARVSKKSYKDSVIIVTDNDRNEEFNGGLENGSYAIPNDIRENPTQLLPLSMRPILLPIPSSLSSSYASFSSTPENRIYAVPAFTSMYGDFKATRAPYFSQFRAVDPYFGGVGYTPVTKRAMSLSASEYTRLGLSGAICTVLVRTLLNPLELVKTKIQLKNDVELLEYASGKDKITASNHMIDRKNTLNSKHVTGTLELEATKITYESNDVSENENVTDATTFEAIQSMVQLRGPQSLFQSADITFLASLVFGSLGFGATELFRRSFTRIYFEGGDGESELILLLAAAVACVVTSFAAAPFEMMRVRSMGLIEPKPWNAVLSDFLVENRQNMMMSRKSQSQPDMNNTKDKNENELSWRDIRWVDLPSLYSGFSSVVSRELPFAVAKFLAFDIVANLLVTLINSQPGVVPIQVGVGTIGLAVSAFSGALAGIAGALVSHPADLVLTLTSGAAANDDIDDQSTFPPELDSKQIITSNTQEKNKHKVNTGGKPDWRPIIQELLRKDGGISNLFIGFPARATFFFLVIGLQFFLYDYVKNLLEVGSDDLTLVLDVFYAVRQGLVEMDQMAK